MRIKNLNKIAFTLLEVLLASIIFIISIGGIFATLNAMRRPVADKESALTAAVFGKQVLEALRSQVSANTSANYYAGGTYAVINGVNACTDFSLTLGPHYVSNTTLGLTWPSILVTPDNVNYPNTIAGCGLAHTPCLYYNVTCADGGATCSSTTPDVARRVDLNIQWENAQ